MFSFLISNTSTPALYTLPLHDALPICNLTYTPAANANGTAMVTVQLQDTGGSANGGTNGSAAQTLTITVTRAKEQTTVTQAPNQTVLHDAGQTTTNNWATAISKGPPNE